MKIAFLILLVGGSAGAASLRADWAGEYASKIKTGEGQTAGAALSNSDLQETWLSSLSISDCTEITCKFSFTSGSMQSECGAEGVFTFKSAVRAEFAIAVEPSTDDGPRGTCNLTFEKRKGPKVFVDATDVFKTKKDEAYGNPCNTLCGFQGARYFAVEIPKVSDVKFYSPSFPCKGVALSKIETQICTSEKLAKLDRDLSDEVAKIKSGDPKSVAKLTTEQRQWLKARDTTCARSAQTETCLETIYEARSKALGAAPEPLSLKK